MKGLIEIVSGLSKWMINLAKVILTSMILLTVADVILRSFRRPIMGTFELVAFSAAMAMGFSIPFTSCVNGHISVDFIILKIPLKIRKIFNIIMKCVGIGLFLIIGSNMIILAMKLQKVGEVSPTLRLPFYPLIFGLGICCFIECLVLFCDIVKISGKKYG
jgi:TRAP-type C4-dicarboxylate transport system permease small subunit